MSVVDRAYHVYIYNSFSFQTFTFKVLSTVKNAVPYEFIASGE